MKSVSKLVALMLALAMLLSLPFTANAFENPFVDVDEGDWFYEDVMTVAEAQVMVGTDSTHFAPESTLTRGMMATILWRLDGAPQAGPCEFSDVEEGKYYYSPIAWARSVGLVSGIGNNKFAPEACVTREQMAAMVYNYAARCFSVRPYIANSSLNLDNYTDGVYVSRYAIEPVRWLLSMDGLHSTNETIRPGEAATRAEVAASIALFLREDGGLQSYNGKSAYELAVENGYVGTVQEWLASLVGPPGKSAYEIAVEHGYQGTEEAWLASLSGKSAYDIAVEHGFNGTEEQWLDSLHGQDGTGVVDAHVDDSLHLILSLSDGTTIDAGYVGVTTGGSSGEEPDVQYTVTFMDYDGTVLKTEQVAAGGSATPPADPVREGYIFTGWNGSYTNVQSNVTVTATYTLNITYYTVTFVDYDGTVLKTEQVAAGGSATPPADPIRPGYNFTGWNGSYTNVQSNVTVTAAYALNTAPTIIVNNAAANIGDSTVQVTIDVANNPGISSLLLTISYDSCLTLTNIAFDPAFGSYVTAPQPYKNPQNISLMSPLDDIHASGTLATLTFEISDSVTAPTVANITLEYDQDNTFDVDFNDVVFQTVNGSVTIS